MWAELFAKPDLLLLVEPIKYFGVESFEALGYALSNIKAVSFLSVITFSLLK